MNIKFEDDSIYLNLSKNCFVHTINQWSQLFGRFNWYTFTPIEIEFENETMIGGFEFVIMLLGLGLRFRYNYNDIVENMSIEVENEIKKIKEKKVKKQSKSSLIYSHEKISILSKLRL